LNRVSRVQIARGPHLRSVAALEKAGFRILRQGAHIVMTDGTRIITIPRHNPINAFTMGGIVREAGLSLQEFRKLLQKCFPYPISRSEPSSIILKALKSLPKWAPPIVRDRSPGRNAASTKSESTCRETASQAC